MTFPAANPPGESAKPAVLLETSPSAAGDGNGEGESRPPARLPSRLKPRRSKVWLATGFLSIVVPLAAGITYWVGLAKPPFKEPTFKVVRKKLVFTVVEGGRLESADNNEYACRVKAKEKNGVATTIKWLVDDGSMVKGPRAEKIAGRLAMLSGCLTSSQTLAMALPLANLPKGDKIIELDDSALQESKNDQKIKVEEADAAAIKAEGDYQVALIDNENKIKLAYSEFLIAKLNLEKYLGNSWQDSPEVICGALAHLAGSMPTRPFQMVSSLLAANKSEGDYQAKLQDTLGKIELALGDRDSWLERASWSRRMEKLGFMSKTQADADQSRLESAEYSLHKNETDLKTLEIEKRVTQTDLRHKLGEKYRNLVKAYIDAKANEAKADSERRTKKSIYDQHLAKYRDIQEEIGKCKMYASRSGLAIYYIPESTRGGFGKQIIVQTGESVSEGQKLILIPDLTRMVVITRVHEAMLSYVKKGQKAEIRIFSNVLKGHVNLVKNVPSAQDWLSSGVTVYECKVAIDDPVEHLQLKPGFSARVTIFADESSDEVLQIPIQAVVGTIQDGQKRKCFVLDPDGQPAERDVVVGMNNDTMVEVREGLKEGEEVVINPTPFLVGEKAKLKRSIPKVGRLGDESGTEKGPGKKGGGKGKGKFNPPGGQGIQKSPGVNPPSGDRKAEWKKKFDNATPEQRKAWMEKFKKMRPGGPPEE